MSAPQQIDRYVVERELGKGAFGTVYRARHAVTGRAVALKVLHPKHAGDVEMVERFFREARAAASTMSPNIVDVLDASIASDGSPFLALELLEGEDLESLLEKEGRLRTLQALQVAREICAGLDAAHRRGVVHRDLKPANVFMARQPDGSLRAKVLDFGMSKLAEPAGSSSVRTGTGAIMGTPLYMAPEQLRGGAREVDARADVYALGAILFRMLSGRLPHEASSLEALLVRKLTEPSAELAALVPGLPGTLLHLVRRCLDADPARRPGSAAEVERELGELARSMTSPAATPMSLPPTVVSIAPPPRDSSRWLVPVLVLALLGMMCVATTAVLGAGGAVWAIARQAPAAAPVVAPPAASTPPAAPVPPEPPAPVDLGARVTATVLGRGASDAEIGITERALPALSRCRTSQREREELEFMWMGMGMFGGSSSLSYTPNPGQLETPVRDCMRDALTSASQGASAMGIVTFTVTLEPRR